MNSRERVQTALNHEEPDRVPIDLGGTVVSSIGIPTYAALRDHLGLPRKEIRVLETVQQIAWVDEDVMEIFGVDVIPVFANPPSGPAPVFATDENGTVSFKDDFGATLRRPKDSFYYDWREFPLDEPSIEAMERMPWPDPADPARYAGLRERVEGLRASTDKALFGMAPCGHDMFNQLLRVRGMEEGLIDLIANPDFAEAFLERYMETICTAQELFLDQVGDLIDVHFAADDLSGQSGPLISPEIYRRMIKPRWARIIRTIKARTEAKIFYHSCGALDEFIPDLIEIGVDIINPVQVSAAGMDSAVLKRKYGRNLAYWGGGCDTQSVLPYGTSADIRGEVRRRIGDLAPGGGFVFNPVHNIQPLVPVGNVTALFEAARAYGRYPISGNAKEGEA
ncbi:uroporphyrinogen decarboxylase family protein [Verrucomicrobiota bacterium]